MSLDPQPQQPPSSLTDLGTSTMAPLTAMVEKRAVQKWLRSIRSKDLDDAMLLHDDFGLSPGELCMAILRGWADAER